MVKVINVMTGWGRFHGGVGRQDSLSISINIYSFDS